MSLTNYMGSLGPQNFPQAGGSLWRCIWLLKRNPGDKAAAGAGTPGGAGLAAENHAGSF